MKQPVYYIRFILCSLPVLVGIHTLVHASAEDNSREKLISAWMELKARSLSDDLEANSLLDSGLVVLSGSGSSEAEEKQRKLLQQSSQARELVLEELKNKFIAYVDYVDRSIASAKDDEIVRYDDDIKNLILTITSVLPKEFIVGHKALVLLDVMHFFDNFSQVYVIDLDLKKEIDTVFKALAKDMVVNFENYKHPNVVTIPQEMKSLERKLYAVSLEKKIYDISLWPVDAKGQQTLALQFLYVYYLDKYLLQESSNLNKVKAALEKLKIVVMPYNIPQARKYVVHNFGEISHEQFRKFVRNGNFDIMQSFCDQRNQMLTYEQNQLIKNVCQVELQGRYERMVQKIVQKRVYVTKNIQDVDLDKRDKLRAAYHKFKATEAAGECADFRGGSRKLTIEQRRGIHKRIVDEFNKKGIKIDQQKLSSEQERLACRSKNDFEFLTFIIKNQELLDLVDEQPKESINITSSNTPTTTTTTTSLETPESVVEPVVEQPTESLAMPASNTQANVIPIASATVIPTPVITMTPKVIDQPTVPLPAPKADEKGWFPWFTAVPKFIGNIFSTIGSAIGSVVGSVLKWFNVW